MAGVRELVYQRSIPLATIDLMIVLSHLDEEAGVIGAAFLSAEALLGSQCVDGLVGFWA